MSSRTRTPALTRWIVPAGATLALLLLSGRAPAQTPPPDAPKPDAPKAEAPKPEAPKTPTVSGLTINWGDTSIKFGTLIQAQADWTQDAVSEGYIQNLKIRRMRFNVAGNVTKNVFFFFQTENSNLGARGGAATDNKVISSGFQVLDAVVEWRIAKEFNLWGGMIYLPTSREALKSSATEFTMDFHAYTFTATTALAGTAGRDTGFLARGYFANDRLEYRVGAFQGNRESGSRNPYRFVGRVQYNVFDKEVYNLPAYAGSYLGTKKILAIGYAYDTQRDYQGMSADVLADLPTSFGSVMAMATWQRLDGGSYIASLQRSHTLTGECGAYLKNASFGLWGRYEQREYSYVAGKDEKRYLGGLNYYIKGHNANLKAAYGRLVPDTGNSTNQFTLQLQAYY